MKKFKGTKGEWTCEHYGSEDWDNHIVIEPINTHVYDVNEEAEANAKLIASAPLLLEALQSIENDNGSITATVWKMRNDAINKALS